MDEELKKLLEKNLEASKKSEEILQKMWRGVVWGRVFMIAKWAIIAALVVFGFITIQPYLAYWTKIATTIAQNLEKVNNFFPK